MAPSEQLSDTNSDRELVDQDVRSRKDRLVLAGQSASRFPKPERYAAGMSSMIMVTIVLPAFFSMLPDGSLYVDGKGIDNISGKIAACYYKVLV